MRVGKNNGTFVVEFREDNPTEMRELMRLMVRAEKIYPNQDAKEAARQVQESVLPYLIPQSKIH